MRERERDSVSEETFKKLLLSGSDELRARVTVHKTSARSLVVNIAFYNARLFSRLVFLSPNNSKYPILSERRANNKSHARSWRTLRDSGILFSEREIISVLSALRRQEEG